uniref:Retrovirus-related Pol polyprotein from transposon TNT 1-94 n=1 Tax=Tanacetum cinerariifolium TaxID=118510 RepID=A0A6L2M298_TANCI|nr:hypothetical protein [Tanacetum cinerariifolium]
MTTALSIENRIINQAITQQATFDEALVSTDDRVEIGKCNMRIDPTKTQKESTYQLWFTISKVKNSSLYRFHLDNKKFKIVVELFCEILRISSQVPNEEFVTSPPHDAIVTFIKSLGLPVPNWLQKTSVRRRKNMPYPRFTKVIINHFLLKHKSISKRNDVFMNTIKHDVILGRLKFVGKGEDNQVYGMSFLDVMINDDIQISKAYQTYLGITIGVIIPKKVRKGMKTTITPKKRSYITTDEDIILDPEKSKRRPTGVVIRDTLNISKKKTLDHSKKLKGMKILTDAAQLTVDTQKAIKASKKSHRLQQQYRGSSEGSGITLEVPNETKVKYTILSKGAGITPEPDPLLNLQVLVIPEQTNTTPIPTPLTTPLPTPPTTSGSPTATTTIPNPLPAVLQIFSNLERKSESWTKVDHSEGIEASVQANLINDTPALLAPSSSTLGQSSSRAAGCLSKYKLKSILFDKMDKSCSYMTHDKHQDVYDALLNSICLEDAITRGDINTDKALRKRERGDDQDPTAGSEQWKKKRRKGKDSEPSKDKLQTSLSKLKIHSKPLRLGNLLMKKSHLKNLFMRLQWTWRNLLKIIWSMQLINHKTKLLLHNTFPSEKDSPTFNEHMATPIDYSKFAMNHLKLDKITKADLVRPVYKLLKGTCESNIKLEYNMDQCYNALTDILD